MLRSLTGLSLIAAVIALVHDAALSMERQRLVATTLGGIWSSLHPGSLGLTRSFLQDHVWPPLWDPGIASVLQWPTWLVLMGLALVLGSADKVARM